MKINFTNADQINFEMMELKHLGKIRSIGGFGVRGILDYLDEQLNAFCPSSEAKKQIGLMGGHWGDWLGSLVISEKECSPAERCNAAYQILKNAICYGLCSEDVRCEFQALGSVLNEAKLLFPNKMVGIQACKTCKKPLSVQDLDGSSHHQCQAYLSKETIVTNEYTEVKKTTLSEFALKHWLKGCLLCGGVLPESKGGPLNKYCDDHNTATGKKYRNGLHQTELVIKYLIKAGELDEQVFLAKKSSSERLMHMWGVIIHRLGNNSKWDLMEIEFKRLLEIASPQKAKSSELERKIANSLADGLSQAEIAKRLGISRQRVNQIKQGKFN